MVRINLINPKALADQHLIAEYNEMLMLLGYVVRYPKIKIINGKSEIPEKYTLGKGHIKFFKSKLLYLFNRHKLLKNEMKLRGFKPTKKLNLKDFDIALINDWQPHHDDYKIIKQRLAEKIKKKPTYYRHFGKHMPKEFFLELIIKG